jgi:hypothetical protein
MYYRSTSQTFFFALTRICVTSCLCAQWGLITTFLWVRYVWNRILPLQWCHLFYYLPGLWHLLHVPLFWTLETRGPVQWSKLWWKLVDGADHGHELVTSREQNVVRPRLTLTIICESSQIIVKCVCPSSDETCAKKKLWRWSRNFTSEPGKCVKKAVFRSAKIHPNKNAPYHTIP